MLRGYGLIQVQKLPGSPILQKNGSLAYISNTVKEYLSRKLGDNSIRRRGPVDWLSSSADLTPLDYLWDYMDEK